jgi:hypothetical protein
MDSETKTKAAKPKDDYAERVKKKREARQKSKKAGSMSGLKLSVNMDALDPRYKYRWVNDKPGRVQQKQAEAAYGGDWEMVPNDDGGLSDGRNMEEGSVISRVVESDGSRAYLMRKPKELWEDDQAARLGKLEEQEKQMQREGVARGSDSLLNEEAEASYRPAQVARAYKP